MDFNEDGLVLSNNYAETMNGQVLPFLAGLCQPISLTSRDGKAIAAFRYDAEQPRGTVVVLHGFTESAEKFSEVIYSLLQNHFSVLTCDQRGHGASWREEKISDPSLTHVDRFEDYVQDLKSLCDQELAMMPKPWYIFAHSMGGAVTLCFLEDHPGVFEKAALCAPMVEPQHGGIPLGVGKAMCQYARLIGKGRERIFFSKPYAGAEDFETSCATGKERFTWYDDLRVRTERYHNNGPTYGWTLEAFRVPNRLLAKGKPENIQIPVRIYSAEDDNQVISERHAEIAARMPKAERKIVPGSKHEIYRSPDEVLFPWWKEILAFFAE